MKHIHSGCLHNLVLDANDQEVRGFADRCAHLLMGLHNVCEGNQRTDNVLERIEWSDSGVVLVLKGTVVELSIQQPVRSRTDDRRE